MAEPWAPSLGDVALHIPSRTRNVTDPGTDELEGTFTANTTPTADEAQAVIDSATLGILSRTGPLDPADRPLLDQARAAAEWRAAADIELAYPNRDADVQVAAQLDQRAQYELATLLSRLNIQSEGPGEVLPSWSAPDPPAWADRDPDTWWPPPGLRYWSGVDTGPI